MGNIERIEENIGENDRVSQNVFECTNQNGFDWDEYQYMCDIADYWNCEE